MPWKGDRPRMMLRGILTGAARTDLAVFFVSESARWNGSIVAKKNIPQATSGADAVTLCSVPRRAMAVAFNVHDHLRGILSAVVSAITTSRLWMTWAMTC